MTTRRRLLWALVATLGLAVLPARAHAQVANWQKGMSFPSWWYGEYDKAGTLTALDQLKGLNAGWVAIIPTWYMKDKYDTNIYPDTYGNTATDSSVRNIIQQAHARGLKVMLKPHVDQKDRTWRGSITPTNTNTWFQSYRTFILHYAQIAAETGCEQMCVGTEFQSMTVKSNSSYWRSIVADIRAAYHGPLTYAANWGATNWGEYYQIDWWDALDYIGVDAYFPLANILSPTVQQVVPGWYSYTEPSGATHRWVDEMKALSQKYGKKVIFTEIGFESNERAANEWYLSGPTNPDMQAMVNCLEATFQVFDKEPWVAGVYWWNWGTDPNSGGTSDVGMWLNNKPGKDTVAKWYGQSGGSTGTDTTPPATPSGLTAQAVSTSAIQLNWNATTDNVGVAGYRVYRGSTRIAQLNALTYTDSGLTASTSYSYRVSAYDAAGNESGLSGAVSTTTASPADSTPPSVPTSLTASPVSTSEISLKWTASNDNVGVAGYNVYRNSLKIASVQTTSYSDSGLSAGTSYTYQVSAYDSSGNTSAPSAAVTGTTTSVAVAPGYDFEDGTQGWTASGTISRVWSDTTQKYQGTRSLGMTAGSLSNGKMGYVSVQPPATLAAGKTVTMQVYLASSQTNVKASGYVQDSAWKWTNGPWLSLKPNAWTQISVVVPSAAKMPLTRLGLQLGASGGGFSGNLMLDDVRWDGITSAPPPPPPSTVIYGFEGSTQGWDFAGGLTKNWVDSTHVFEGSNSLGLWATNLSSSNMGYTSVVPPSTLVPGKTVSIWVYLESAQTNVGAAPYVQDGAWQWAAGNWVTLKPNGWTQIQVTVPSTAKTPLTRVGVQFACSSAYNGAVKIDAVNW